jgi:hypothetical protein
VILGKAVSMIAGLKKMAFVIVLLPAIFTYIVLIYFIEPRQDAANEALWGYRLTSVGFVITLMGFAVTIFQTVRAVNAAEAAQNSVKRLREALGSFDIIGMLGGAESTVQEGLTNVGSQSWEALLGCFNRLNTALSKLIAAPNYLDDLSLETAKNLKGRIVDACMALRKSQTESVDTLDVDILEQNLRDLEDFLIKLGANLKERVDV